MKKFTREQIDDAYKNVPPSVRDMLDPGYEIAELIAGLGKRLGLHVDVIGKIAELNRNMLLGLITPPEFLQELLAAGISDADAKQIITEINQQIFVPLREGLRKGGAPTPVQGGTHFHLENKLPSRPAVVRQPAVPPTTAPLPPKMPVPKPIISQSEKKLLTDHEEPHIEFKPAQPPILPGSNVPVPATPPAQPAPEVKVPVQPQVPPPTPPKPQPPAPTSYSVDPYREPLE